MHPQYIGRYEIRSLLGKGGMATVYRAFDPQVKREVAIKVIHSDFATEQVFRERMFREVQAVASLEHPAVVPVYDFGEAEDGTLYMVMRLMQGGSLKERLKQHGRLSPEETLSVVQRIADALDEAHRLGIVHRDLKPGNVLFDRFGHAYLADFGIARMRHVSSATLTGFSRTVGTPAYMSPEQVRGAKDLDGRSDVYALGIMVFQMLTGRLPYQGETSLEIMLKHLQEPPPDLTAFRPDLPSAVAEVLRRAMAKHPDERYPTAGVFAQALQVALREGRVITPQETTTLTPLVTPQERMGLPKRPRRLRRLGLMFAVLIGLALAFGAATWLWGQRAFLTAAVPTATVLEPDDKSSSTSGPTPAPLASPTPLPVVLPTATSVPPSPTATTTSTLTPTPVPTPTVPPPPVVGGADLFAFVASDNNLYLATMDGRQVRPLTHDGAEKRELQWVSYDTLLYLSGKCVFLVNVTTEQSDLLTCFPGVDTLDGFRVSPDGKQVAITLDEELFIVEKDFERLRTVNDRATLLSQLKVCATFDRDRVLEVRWAQDGRTVAARVRVPSQGRIIEQIEVLRIDCRGGITRQHMFPGHRFEMTTFDQMPLISSFDWDGDKLFVFSLFWRNGGYGDLYLYSRETYTGQLINPMGRCCYRDPRWSPDGRYILVAYQSLGTRPQSPATALYLIPVGTWGTGMSYSPLPLPEELFTSPRVAPMPALRPAP